MHNGDFILERQMVHIIKDVCQKRNIQIEAFSDDWILRLSRNNQMHYVYGYHFGLNNGASVEISNDKVATYQLLNAAHIPAVPHLLASTRATQHDSWSSHATGWNSFLIKPTHGGGGRGIRLFSDVEAAKSIMSALSEQDWCVSPFLPIKKETRLVMLDGEVLLAFEKHDPVLQDGIPMFNLRLGARAVNREPSDEIVSLAKQTQQTLGLRLTTVDIVELENGESMVLELNDGFSLEHYMKQDEANLEHAHRVYDAIITKLFE
ncbi:MAG: hypothetical protein JWM52_388 [Candidatus Saccharibacteria bacterium]|nr:hypothetical protein [Candidatus Saccharibacteria bacterium]